MNNIFSDMMTNQMMEPFLPFLFVLAIVYGLLTVTGKSKAGVGFFGKNSVNFVISLVFAFFAAGYQPFLDVFYQYFGVILWIFVGLFFITFLKELFGSSDKDDDKSIFRKYPTEIMILALAGLLSLIHVESEDLARNLPVTTENFVMIAGLTFLVIVFWIAGKIKKTNKG